MNGLKQTVLNWAVRGLLNPILEDVLWESKDKKLFVGNQELSANDEQELKAEAKMIEKSLFYRLFLGMIRKEATLRIAEQSKSWEDVFFGKAMLREIKVFTDLVSALANRETKIDRMSKK